MHSQFFSFAGYPQRCIKAGFPFSLCVIARNKIMSINSRLWAFMFPAYAVSPLCVGNYRTGKAVCKQQRSTQSVTSFRLQSKIQRIPVNLSIKKNTICKRGCGPYKFSHILRSIWQMQSALLCKKQLPFIDVALRPRRAANRFYCFLAFAAY